VSCSSLSYRTLAAWRTRDVLKLFLTRSLLVDSEDLIKKRSKKKKVTTNNGTNERESKAFVALISWIFFWDSNDDVYS